MMRITPNLTEMLMDIQVMSVNQILVYRELKRYSNVQYQTIAETLEGSVSLIEVKDILLELAEMGKARLVETMRMGQVWVAVL